MEYSKARRLAEIIVRLRIRKVTAEERAFLNDWLDESEANRQTYKRIVRGESIARRLKTEETIQSSTDFAQITEQIARRLTRKHRRPWRIGAWSAAAAIVAATVGYFALFHEPEPAFVPYAMERVVAAATPIADAKVLLVTADGKQFDLEKELPDSLNAGQSLVRNEKGQLVYEQKDTPSPTKIREEWHKVITSIGGEYFVRLGDGIDFARYDARQPESFSFFAYDVNPTASLAVNLRTALDTLPPADNTVTDAQVLVAASPVTLVPLAHFREEDCAALYGYCFPESQGCEVYYDVLPTANAVLLFALQRQLARTLEDTFGSVHYVSALTPLMRHFADKSSQGGQRLYAYAAEGRLHLSVFEGGRLLMANSYRMQAPTDAAYYLLNMARRTGTDPQTATFYVAGSSDLRDAILGELRKYVRQVNAIHPAAEFNRHPVVRNKQVPYDLACFLLEMS